MNKNSKTLLTILGVIIILLLVGGIIYFILKKDKIVEYHAVTGTVVEKTNFSLLIVDEKGLEYMININDSDYAIGDYIAVYTTSPILETYPSQITASKIISATKTPATGDATPVLVIYATTNISSGTKITADMVATKYVPINEVENMNIYLTINEVVGKYVVNYTDIVAQDYFRIGTLTSEDPNKTTNKNNTTNNNGNSNNTGSNGSNSNNSNNSTSDKNKTEQDVVNYFNTLNSNLDNNPKNNESSIKKGFVTIVDFLFYDGTIYGKKFSDLTDSAKMQVLKAALYIDSKIDTVFPGYKESISTTANKVYTKVKTSVITIYLDLTTKICTKSPDVCIQAKSDFADMKKSFSLTWDFLVELAGSGISKLSEWYLIWRET